MMKLVFMLLFLMPLSFFVNYWFMTFLISLVFFFFFFSISFNFLYLNISYMMGLDLLSYLMIMLSLWIGFLMFLSSGLIYNSNDWTKLFMFVINFLIFSLVMTFIYMNLFMFYLFFEISIIPTLFLIIGWGYQPERLQAGLYLLFYTLIVSLPMMVSIFYYYMISGSLDFFFFGYFEVNVYIYFIMNLVFFIKVPMYMVHLWLPKAHVEAPLSGSMILAGVMLKLGGYGLMRLMKMYIHLGVYLNMYFISVSCVGVVIISFVCIRQSDMKSLIAYSSICHMGLVLMGILSMNYWGMLGSLCMMIAHGLCSSGLFCLVNIMYERLMSRSLYLNKGLISIFPSLSLWWFLLVINNMSAPPSMNLLGEIVLIGSLMSYNNLLIFFLIVSSFMSAVYSLYLYSFSQHGKFYKGVYSMSVINIREFMLLFLHWFPLNFMILKGDMFLYWI